MSTRLFSSPDYPSVPTADGSLYPVHRIFCVGRNYVEHAKEMGVEVDREAPFYFLKDAQAIVPTGATIPYPPGTENFHYEMELMIAIGSTVFQANDDEAAAAIWGYGCGLDMTRRDLQLAARAKSTRRLWIRRRVSPSRWDNAARSWRTHLVTQKTETETTEPKTAQTPNWRAISNGDVGVTMLR